MEIKIRESPDSAAWSASLGDFNFSLFNTPEWIESICSEKDRRIYLDFCSSNEIIAKIAGLSVNTGRLFPGRLLFYAGPAARSGKPESIIDDCFLALVQFAKKNKYIRLEILSYDYPHRSVYRKKYGFSERSEFIIDLTQSKEQIMNNMSRNIRRCIHKAIDAGFKFRKICSETVAEQLFGLMTETKRIRLSKGYSDYNFFYFQGFKRSTLAELMKNNALNFYVVERDGIQYAIQCILELHRKAYALFIGIREEGYTYGIPSLIDYSVIGSLKTRQFQYINFGGVPTDKTHQGIAAFKIKLGAKQHFSTYGSTNFLILPFSLINPIVKLARKFHVRQKIRKVTECFGNNRQYNYIETI